MSGRSVGCGGMNGFRHGPFCLLITLEGLAASLVLSVACALIRKAVKAPEEKDRFEDMSSVRIAWRILLFAPVAETLMCQGALIFFLKAQG